MTSAGEAAACVAGPDGPGDDADRFARQRIIPGWDQGRLGSATVVVIGVGALGNEVAKNLALAGTGRLVLCDPDVVAASNLSRTVLFTDADAAARTPKAEAAAAALRRLAPAVDTDPRVADLVSGVGLGELADADLVIGCVDTLRARVQLLGRCALAGAPLLDGGTSPWGAELRLRLAPDEPCFGCTLSAHQRSMSDLPWSCAEPLPDERPQAAGIATTAVAAGWLCSAAFGLLFGTVPAWRLLSIDVTAGRAGLVTAARDPRCPLHHPLTGPVLASPASTGSSVADFLATLGPGDEAQAWNSFPVPTTCPRCGYAADAQYPGGARNPGGAQNPGGARNPGEAQHPASRCPRCGTVLRERRSTRLRDADPGATLRSLGVAPGELLPVTGAGGELTCHRLRGAAPRATGRTS
jgi:molybdopterin-synthase adenylyltransferase